MYLPCSYSASNPYLLVFMRKRICLFDNVYLLIGIGVAVVVIVVVVVIVEISLPS